MGRIGLLPFPVPDTTSGMTTVDNTQLSALVSDLEAKEQSLADASASNDSAQAAAQAAATVASSALSAKNDAHSALAASVKALVDYANSLAT
jgi:hypothetical protein